MLAHFVIHAPRQTGKSMAMMALAKQLTKQGKFLAVLVPAEVGAPFSSETGKAELAILGSWSRTTKGEWRWHVGTGICDWSRPHGSVFALW
jgi:hypothetical protein